MRPGIIEIKTAKADRRHEMVALLVLFTIVGCLVADSILLSVRERRAAVAGQAATVGQHAMVFAQDGGKPVKDDKETEREVEWEDVSKK